MATKVKQSSEAKFALPPPPPLMPLYSSQDRSQYTPKLSNNPPCPVSTQLPTSPDAFIRKSTPPCWPAFGYKLIWQSHTRGSIVWRTVIVPSGVPKSPLHECVGAGAHAMVSSPFPHPLRGRRKRGEMVSGAVCVQEKLKLMLTYAGNAYSESDCRTGSAVDSNHHDADAQQAGEEDGNQGDEASHVMVVFEGGNGSSTRSPIFSLGRYIVNYCTTKQP
ncbi:hypothetical protein CVT26_004397 [Gymnopilus dilepis]|uniref:Uncharacterized protein n=1 Tax=Gymnopilus dilepis TaxID=231916 RepID=A0A409WY89_9AGAR|nr:hypothetical protein CVT26_004397 [Gymnopilus dilepis]